MRPATGSYIPETYSVRLSIKLFNCTPENLPSDLRDQLTSWMSAMPGGAQPCPVLASHAERRKASTQCSHSAAAVSGWQCSC